MVFTCKLCSVETVYLTSLCPKCTRVRHLISIYGNKVYSTLEQVLVTGDEKQKELCKTALKEEIRSQIKKVQTDSDSSSDSE